MLLEMNETVQQKEMSNVHSFLQIMHRIKNFVNLKDPNHLGTSVQL